MIRAECAAECLADVGGAKGRGKLEDGREEEGRWVGGGGGGAGCVGEAGGERGGWLCGVGWCGWW